jgi:hypothetical protein
MRNKQKPILARQTSQYLDIPAPIGGLNTRDSKSSMPITDAVILTNYVVQANGVFSRNGYTGFAISLSSYVGSILNYVYNTSKFFIAASGAVLYKVALDGAITSLATGLASDDFESALMGQNMILVNGVDAPRKFDGTSITTPSYTGHLGSYGAEKIDGIHKYRNRLYMWDRDTSDFYYGSTNAISGNFDKFELGLVSETGGNILEIKSLTRDAGNGSDDYIVFILETGEVLIYQGGDPSSATDFSLIGRYRMPPLISKKCVIEYGGDVLCLTKSDLVKLTEVIKYTGENGAFNLQPSKLSGAIQNDYAVYGANEGWQLTSYPKEGWIIINVPETTNSVYHQYILNTVTNAPSKFTNWNGTYFRALDDYLYFGGNTSIYKANYGQDDNSGEIPIEIQQAFSTFGVNQKKKVNDVALLVEAEGDIDLAVAIAYDYNEPPTSLSQISSFSGADWDDEDWDAENWSGKSTREVNYTPYGFCSSISLYIKGAILGQKLNYLQAKYNYEISKTFQG